jgi:Protein of unknown function (DUF1073)
MPMSYWKDVWRIIKGADTSTFRNSDGSVAMRDARHFRSMALSSHERVVNRINDAQKEMVERIAGVHLIGPEDVRKQADAACAPLSQFSLRGIGAGSELVKRTLDSFVGADFNMVAGMPPGGYDLNTAPQFGGMTEPNLWIDPGKAAIIYAAGGLPTLIINKKCKPIAYNGIRIVNPRLSGDQMERVNESAQKNDFPRALTNAGRDGLTYGGSIVFPMFRRDVPGTMLMDIATLMKLDVVGKDCIDRYTVLDRNNAIHIPNWNPTAADFLNPRFYFIPYLGSDINGQRIGRIVPIPQAGYWGAIMTMGWGVSEIQGWYRSVCNYESVAHALPRMIAQMSILVRTFNVDLANALNGAVGLREMDLADMESVRAASNENPITMDIIGDLKAVERDFTAVAELTRIVRQDVGMKANLPEEELWSSDRGAFSSGDQTDGVNERQWEGVKYVHQEIQDRGRNLAMLEVINALGKDRDILRALPYTRIEILPPRIENAEKRAQVVKDLSESTFNFVASGMQLESALTIVLRYGDEHLAPASEVLERVKEHQAEMDAQAEEDHELDAELKQKQIDAPVASPGAPGGSSSASKPDEKKGYSKLEQRKHETTRGAGARREGLQKAEGKKL